MTDPKEFNDVKKVFVEINQLLEENENKKIKTIYPQLLELMESKQRSTTFKTDDDNNVTEIFCYYHKQWEHVDTIPYAKKSSNKTGLNTMCKEGQKMWSKQQKEFKDAKEAILEQVIKGEVLPEEVEGLIEQLEEERKKIVPYPDAETQENTEETTAETEE